MQMPAHTTDARNTDARTETDQEFPLIVDIFGPSLPRRMTRAKPMRGGEVLLWESERRADGRLVPVRPVERRVSVEQVLLALEPIMGRVDKHFVYELIRAGKLDAIQPGAVARGKVARNHAWRVCSKSVANFIGEILG